VFFLPAIPPDPGPAGTAQAPAPVPSPAQEPAPATAAAQGKYLVQAGSFQVRENAEYLAADLVKKGFSPTVVQDSFQGKDRFRVLAGAGLARDRAQDLLEQLAGAGYSGFLASEP
jgi:cell division protein FtsN